MKVIKLIDLLVKIANEEDVPNEIKYKNKIYTYHKGYDFNYCYSLKKCSGNTMMKSEDSLFRFNSYKNNCWNDNSMIEFLNEEVEIIEDTPKENKKIEKLDLEDDGNTITLFGEKENEWTILDNVDIIVCNKINEIIDKINRE